MASEDRIELMLLAFVLGCGSNAWRAPSHDSSVVAPATDTMPAPASADAGSSPDRAPVESGTRDGTVVEGGEAAAVPAALTTFANDVRVASDAALGGSGPQVCSVAVPSVQVAASSDVDAAIVSYISAIVGVPETALAVSPQNCGDPDSAPCANIFQNDVAHFGGSNAVTTYPLAQQLEATAANVRLAIFSPTDLQGMRLPAVVVMSGIHDGWLMAIATFGDRTTCQ